MGSGATRRGVGRLALLTTVLVAAVVALRYVGHVPDRAPRHVGSVQIAGSETIRPVVAACAEAFMTSHPQADIVVRGGGSGDGIAALLHGLIDIGMISRDLSPRERDYAASKGMHVSVFEMALDGITVIVNQASSIVALDPGQLRDIFAGRIRNWRELGGAGGEGEIVVFARAAGSGTASLFDERVLGGDSYAPSVQRLPTNEAIAAEVASRPGGIGYSSLGALREAGDRIKVVAIQTGKQSGPVSPTPEAVRSGLYPLTRTLSLSVAAEPTGAVKAFIDFCSSAGGQAFLQRAGYIGAAPNPR